MAEELQSLLDRIQNEGIAKAEAEAGRIIDTAGKKADAIIAEAERKADAHLATARKEAEQFEQRARNALQQAARDMILSVGEALTDTARKVIAAATRESLDGDTLAALIADAVKGYFQQTGDNKATVLTSPEAEAAARETLAGVLAREILDGITIASDSEIISGFVIKKDGDSVQHNFTGEALTEALCKLLRPGLAEIVREAATKV